MKELGFVRVGAAVPQVVVADCLSNIENIYSLIKKAQEKKISILTFPELSITGYTCADLFLQDILIDECEKAIESLLQKTKDIDMVIAVGAPVRVNYRLFNCAVVMFKGEILCIVPKTYLPNYGEFYEKRWFNSAKDTEDKQITYCGQFTWFGSKVLIQHEAVKELCIGIEICEDLWSAIPPSSYQALAGANLILNLSASNDYVGKSQYRRDLVANQSARCMSGYVYASAGFGESSTDLVFGGHSMICENGSLLAETKKYEMDEQLIYSEIDVKKLNAYKQRQNSYGDGYDVMDDSFVRVYFDSDVETDELTRYVNKTPFIPNANDMHATCDEIFNIQINGLAKRIKHIGSSSMVIGISGGLDSTLALLVCAKTCDKLGIDRNNIKAVTMPGFGTSDRTYHNAVNLIKNLNADFREVSIKDSVIQHFKDINHDMSVHDVTYENSQARERTQILMDIANQENGIVVGTGDLSELALGWATFNGDHMSMYGVNASIPKTLIRYLVKWIAENEFDDATKEILLDVVDTPVSPELLPPDKDGKIAQKTEELVGPYELHDFYLYNVLRYGFSPAKVYYLACKAFDTVYDRETIYKWLRNFYWRFFSQQFKRSTLPDGPKVGSICLSPRGDLRMPSDASVKMWMKELESINK